MSNEFEVHNFYNHTPETTNKEVGKLLIKDIQQIVKDNWY